MIELFFNKDTIDAWISVLGTFLGSLFAGVISVLIAIWTINKQKNMSDSKAVKNKEKGIQMIKQFVDFAISSLLLIQLDVDEKEVRVLDENKVIVELKKIKSVNFKLKNIPSELIAMDINISFQNIRILLKILELELDKVLKEKYDCDKNYINALNGTDIVRRTELIIKELNTFTEISHLTTSE